MYLKIKRAADSFLSAMGLIVLSPLFLILILWIKLDSRGPVLFKQKRIGIHKKPFYILKFRTMRTDTPKDMPTHLLQNPDQYITRAGHFLRKTSLDELPQIINILLGDMSIIGPRPALWNDFVGWNTAADGSGEYVEKLRKNGFSGFLMDCRCFLGTVGSVLRHEGVVEGGTGEMARQKAGRKGK